MASEVNELTSHESGPPMSGSHMPPAWWADALITD
jgi:hypothetical protein